MTTRQTFELNADDPAAGVHYDVLVGWLVGLRDPLKGTRNQRIKVASGFKGQIKKITVIVDAEATER